MPETGEPPTNFIRLRGIPEAQVAPENARKWLVIKFGLKTPSIRDNTMLIAFCDEICKLLNEQDLRLDIRPSSFLSNAKDEQIISETLDNVTKDVLENPPLRLPMLLFIEDIDGSDTFAKLQTRYHNHMFMFLVTGEEADQMIRSNDFSQAREWCEQFAEIVAKNDITRAQDYPTIMRRREEDENRRRDTQRAATLPRPVHVSQAHHNDSENSYGASPMDYVPVLVESEDEECAQILKDAAPCEVFRIIDTPELSTDVSPPLRLTVTSDEVIEALDVISNEPNLHTSTLITMFFSPSLQERLNHPFDDLCLNIKLLEVITLACLTERQDMENIVHDMLEVTVTSGFVMHILDDFLFPLIEGRIQIDLEPEHLAYCVSTVFGFFKTLSLKQLINPQTMKLWNKAFAIYEELPTAVRKLMPSNTKRTLQIIMEGPEAKIEQRTSSKEINTNDTPYIGSDEDGWGSENVSTNNFLKKEFTIPTCGQMPTSLHLNMPCLWAESEKTAPPGDFRKLSTKIIRSDLVNPDKPYLRRMKTEGSFTNAEEYLDTVYRLFREDMVSPLRDGLFIWKQHGYNPRRDPDGLAPDLFIMEDVRIRGIRAKSGTGETMRMIEIPRQHLTKILEQRKLPYGQMIGLSSDGFKENIHLALVVERDDELLKTRNYIGISFIDEMDGLDKGGHAKLDTAYCLIESQAFIEMYTHVLTSIKKMNRFLPIPFERYIVHGFTDVLRPAYMRLETPENVIEERARLETYYTGKRLEAKAKIIERNIERERERESRLAIEKNNTVKTEYQKSRRKRNEKLAVIDLSETDLVPMSKPQKMSDVDREAEEIREQIEEAEDFVPRPYAPNQRMLKEIAIRDDDYDISTLHAQFDPNNVLMDKSQRNALFQALTQEFVIIQGPPGTGKTFIGVEIIAALLANRLRWCITEPVLVVCYTNQALDQFLERIHRRIQEDMVRGRIDHEGPIVARLGTRSESAYIKEIHKLTKRDVIEEWREQLPPLQQRGLEPPRVLYSRRDETGCFITPIFELQLGSAATILRLATTRMIDGKNTMLAMSELHQQQFLAHYVGATDTKGHALSPDEKLVSWLLERQFSRDAQNLPRKTNPKNDFNSEDSDTETSGKKDVASEAQGYIIPQKTSNLEDVFRQLTMKLAEIRDNGVVNTKEEIFEVLESWRFGRDQDAETQRMEREVLLFGKLIKQGDIRFNNAKITQDPVIIKAMNEHEHNILKAEPLTESEAEEIQNIFTLPKQRRWQLYAYWRQNLIRRTRALLPDIMTTYKKCCDAIKDYRLLEDANILRKSLVIGATTTGAAKNRKLLEMLKCRSVIVEEAAEVLEAHVLSTFLPSVEHVVLIGDHEQLRPNPSVYMLARDYGLDCSLFERLCKNKFPLTTLEVQHRMREEITKIIVRPHFYKNLLDHDDIKQYPAVKGLDKNLFFWTHKFEEVNLGTDSVSHRNDYEIVQAVELTRYLLKQGAYEKNEITVLCTYAAQTTAMREAISQLGTTIDGRTEVPVETVDGFQGKENRVIILSLVRSISESNTVGFLGVKNRICVSWTRAQHGLYVLGNMEFLATKSCLWQELATSLTTEGMVDYYLPIRCSTHGRLQKIGCPDEFTKKSPEGGCDMDCLSSLPCSHKCPRKCHPIDDHEIWKCETLVLKTCARKVHQAEKLCCEQYGPCSRMVDISLPCNHITQIACFMNDSEARCSHRCEQSLPCEHQCAKRCSEPCDVICNQLVPMPFSECPYGHTTKIPCQEVARFLERMVPCDQPCTEILVCGHKCSNKCGDDCTFECQMKLKRKKKCGHDVEMMCYEDPDIVKCQELVLRKLNGCGHESMVPCFAGKSQKYCTKVCLKTLECGLGNSKHTCTRKCGECYEGGHMCTSTCEKTFTCGHLCLARCGVACPPCEQPCYTQCEHQICGRPKGPEDHRIGFDRTCPGLCALCIKACSNSCVHRACSKKCFEICDVSACNEHCTKALKCGHPCLGFCGEACPDLCFSCGRQQYDYLIKTFVSSDLATETALSQFVKLSCSHIFPASFLDTHVKGCREKKTIVTCPLKNCRLPIQLSQRYSGACKRAIIAREKEKAVRLGQASVLLSVTDQTQPQDATRSLLIRIAKIAQDLKSSQPGKKNTTITIHDRFTALLRLANKFEQCLRVKSLVQDIDYGGAENYLEWHNSLRLLECLVQLHRNLQFNQQKKLKKIPQARLCWLNQMFTLLQNDVSSVEDALSSHICELANVVEDNLGSRLPGTYIPLVLFEIHKLAFNVTFLMLFRCISGAIDKVVDITKDQCKEIEKLARKFQSTDRHNERHLLFGILMALLNREVLLPQKKALSGFQMPDFIFPKF